jgi:pimeloyl-ACP methyl ester carboxylesterase
MSAVRRRYADTPEGQLHYRERPGEDGLPILFLHQTASSSVMWERVFACYPPGRRLIAVDTPGFGLSDPPPELPAEGLAYYARRIEGLLDVLGLDQVDVAAHHTGAMIALELCLRAPQRIRRQALLGTVLVTPEEGAEWMRDHVTKWSADARGDFVTNVLLPRMHVSVTTDDPEHMLLELTAYLQAGESWWWAYDAVFGYDGRARLPQVTTPSLVAVGADEAQIMLDWTKATADLIPGAEYVELEGLGCEMAFQDPQATTAAIADYLGD